MWDIDGDGMTEIVVAGWDKNVYVWDYDFPFSPGQTPPWPQFHHDPLRTGYAATAVPTDVGGGGGDEPAAEFRSVELGPPAPNPAQGGTRLWYGVPAGRAGARLDLAIYDLSGRRVRTLEQGLARAGAALRPVGPARRVGGAGRRGRVLRAAGDRAGGAHAQGDRRPLRPGRADARR